MTTPFLLDHELQALTHPLRQPAAQRRWLDSIGVRYIQRPDGRPIVARTALESRLDTAHRIDADSPNAAVLKARFTSRNRENGTTPKNR